MLRVAVTADRDATREAASPANPLMPLAVRDLTFAVDGKVIVDGISFRLEDSRRTVILGPNGAGKSILMRLCHGLIPPTAGSITWAGEPPRQVSRRQQMVFQRSVMLRRSVRGNVDHALAIMGIPRAGRREVADAALAQAGLAEKAGQAARTLSGGEQQRLAIARAAAPRPDVLLLDEPCSNLDPEATRNVEELIRRIGATGTKIIMTTHDIPQARRLAEDVLFLHRGALLEHSPAPRFFDDPAHPAARRFLDGALLA